jgi:uncharacterized protein (TIGR00255 family)
MTGFGRATVQGSKYHFSVDIKSLNSKGFDLSLRGPHWLRNYEMEIRKSLQNKLIRGKIEVQITAEIPNTNTSIDIPHNQLIETVEYFQNILKVTGANGDALQAALRTIDIKSIENNNIEDIDLNAIYQTIDQAAENLANHRLSEGKAMEEDLLRNIEKLEDLLKQTEPFERERVENIRKRLTEKLEQVNVDYEKNRLEQELIYYLEKLDVNEEKVRLKQHLLYFREEVLQDQGSGRKLNFIGQEIGREINTLGSKSQHDQMQRIVVEMKDTLEQIKEINLNIL